MFFSPDMKQLLRRHPCNGRWQAQTLIKYIKQADIYCKAVSHGSTAKGGRVNGYGMLYPASLTLFGPLRLWTFDMMPGHRSS